CSASTPYQSAVPGTWTASPSTMTVTALSSTSMPRSRAGRRPPVAKASSPSLRFCLAARSSGRGGQAGKLSTMAAEKQSSVSEFQKRVNAEIQDNLDEEIELVLEDDFGFRDFRKATPSGPAPSHATRGRSPCRGDTDGRPPTGEDVK